MAKSWKASLGNLWGGFRVGQTKALPLVSPGEFRISDDGKAELSARYDPPGSGWRALIAAIATGVIVNLMAQATGACAGPGWLIWYIIVILMRRQPVTLNLENCETAVVDSANRRFGFLTDFLGAKRWVAFEVGENFDDALQSLEATMAVVTGVQITRRLRAATIAIIVAVGLMAVLIVLSMVIYMAFRARARP